MRDSDMVPYTILSPFKLSSGGHGSLRIPWVSPATSATSLVSLAMSLTGTYGDVRCIKVGCVFGSVPSTPYGPGILPSIFRARPGVAPGLARGRRLPLWTLRCLGQFEGLISIILKPTEIKIQSLFCLFSYRLSSAFQRISVSHLISSFLGVN